MVNYSQEDVCGDAALEKWRKLQCEMERWRTIQEIRKEIVNLCKYWGREVGGYVTLRDIQEMFRKMEGE